MSRAEKNKIREKMADEMVCIAHAHHVAEYLQTKEEGEPLKTYDFYLTLFESEDEPVYVKSNKVCTLKSKSVVDLVVDLEHAFVARIEKLEIEFLYMHVVIYAENGQTLEYPLVYMTNFKNGIRLHKIMPIKCETADELFKHITMETFR